MKFYKRQTIIKCFKMMFSNKMENNLHMHGEQFSFVTVYKNNFVIRFFDSFIFDLQWRNLGNSAMFRKQSSVSAIESHR